MKRKTLLTSILAIVMSLSMIAGATFALFTSESQVDISVTSGTVNVEASIDETSVYTKQLYDTDYTQGATNMYEGVATFTEDGLTLEKILPGDGIKFNIIVKNESDVTIKYRTIISCAIDTGLFAGLDVSIGDKNGYNGVTLVSNWAQLEVGSANAIIPVVIELPEGAGNEYQDKTCTISYKVEAVQGNAQVEDPADGTIYIYSANDLKALSGKYLVANNGKAEIQNIELMSDIDLNGAEFKEIGVAYGDTMNFKGNGYTISNMKLATGGHNGMTNVGMFYIDSGATLNVENLKLVAPVVEDAIDEYATGAAAVVGYANGAVNLSNVDVESAKINNTFGNAAVHVGYSVNVINLVDCDIIGTDTTVSGEVENGAVRMDKTGSFIATANTTSCVATINNYTNESAYNIAGRVINGATLTVDGAHYITSEEQLRDLASKATESVVIFMANDIILGNDTQTCNAVEFKNTTSLVINGNGHTLTMKGKAPFDDNDGSVVASIVATSAQISVNNLTIVNNKLSANGTLTSPGRNTVYSVVRGLEVVFDKVDFVGGVQVRVNTKFINCSFKEDVLMVNNEGYATDGRFCVFIDHEYAATGTYEFTFEECTFDASGYGCVKVAGDNGANITVNVKNCSFVNTCPSNSWSTSTPKYDIKCTGSNIILNDQGGNTWDQKPPQAT